MADRSQHKTSRVGLAVLALAAVAALLAGCGPMNTPEPGQNQPAPAATLDCTDPTIWCYTYSVAVYDSNSKPQPWTISISATAYDTSGEPTRIVELATGQTAVTTLSRGSVPAPARWILGVPAVDGPAKFLVVTSVGLLPPGYWLTCDLTDQTGALRGHGDSPSPATQAGNVSPTEVNCRTSTP